MGFYFKWNITENGLPSGCPGFQYKDSGKEMTNDQFRNKLLIVPDCPKQDLDDGSGKELWKSVEDFADDQELWIEEFVEVFEKMQCNGYESLEQGPKDFWSHF